MITPNKYINLDLSILHVGAKIIDILTKEDMITYSDLLYRIKDELNTKQIDNFDLSLVFLYSFDAIEYSEDLDTLSLKDEDK